MEREKRGVKDLLVWGAGEGAPERPTHTCSPPSRCLEGAEDAVVLR